MFIHKHGLLNNNKAYELQIQNDWRHTIFDFGIELTHEGDHAGFRFRFIVYKFILEFTIYDTRHWDYENNKWEVNK